MVTKTYPIGSKVKFLYHNRDEGKLGKIVGIHNSYPLIRLFEPSGGTAIFNGIKCHWKCYWHQIEPVPQKNQQLLFDFMEK